MTTYKAFLMYWKCIMNWLCLLLTCYWCTDLYLYILLFLACFPVLGMQPPLAPATVRELVRSHLHLDPVAADVRCSLFVAAVQNYKHDSVLRPFPPRYLRGEIKDFEELVSSIVVVVFCDATSWIGLCIWDFGSLKQGEVYSIHHTEWIIIASHHLAQRFSTSQRKILNYMGKHLVTLTAERCELLTKH